MLYVPTPHVIVVALTLPDGHAKPALQFPLQLAFVSPDDAPNTPAGHVVHTPAPTPLYCPAAHIAAVAFVLPAAHACPALQFPLHAALVRAGVAPNVPAGHGPLHAALVKPETLPYVPAGHTLQAAAPPRLYHPARQMDAVALVDPAMHA